MKNWWASFVSAEDDYRPLTSPPNPAIIGWWCSGYDAADNATLCLWIRADDEESVAEVIRKDWPEFDGAFRIGPDQMGNEASPGDRFPLSDWMEERAIAATREKPAPCSECGGIIETSIDAEGREWFHACGYCHGTGTEPAEREDKKP